MVLAMLMAIVITINVSAGESISKAKIDEYLYTIAYSQQEQVKEPIYGSIDGEWNIIGLARYGAVTKDYISKYKENLLKEKGKRWCFVHKKIYGIFKSCYSVGFNRRKSNKFWWV